MTTFDGKALAESLAAASRAAIDGAIETAAARAAAEIAGGMPEAEVRIAPRAGAAAVTLAGPGLFAREFGALDSAADPVIAPALQRLKRRPA